MAARRKRAAEACSFCRRRKIKCNGAHPTCLNCQAYDQECVYEPVGDVEKEVGRRRHRQGKRQKSDNACNSKPSSPTPTRVTHATGSADIDDGPNIGTPHVETTNAPSVSAKGGVARILMSPNGVSSYHSRTSTLYEDNVLERPSEGNARPQVADEWVERGLVAEAARQRQLENLNCRRGRLDFDGVDPELGMHLLSIHWNRQHHSFLLTYRPAFMRDMACGGPYFSKLLLNAIYFGASKFSPRLEVRRDAADVRTAGWRFRSRVRELLGSALDRSSITTIQALLQMTNSLFALGDERSAAWLYAGLAFRMLIDLGMHVDLSKTDRFSDEDLEIRRRVFWGAFVVDKMQSLYQGRPASLRDTDVLVPIKFLDTYEELEYWQPFAYSSRTTEYPGSPAYSVSTFAALCKLSLAMSDILCSIYTERSVDQTPTKLSSTLESLQLKLDAWKAALPEHIQLNLAVANPQDSTSLPPPHVFSLHAMHNVLIILLHRPFVADGHLYNTSRSMLVDSFMKCATAASNICNILRAYHKAFSIRHAPYLMSYATYVAATIVVRIAAKRPSESTIYANLATCMAVFKENQETNFAVRKATMVIETLMKKLGIVVDQVLANISTAQASSPMAFAELAPRTDESPTSGSRQSAAVEIPRVAPEGSGMTSFSSSASGAADCGIAGSSHPEWVEIDGIIQSFLQNGSGSNARPILALDQDGARSGPIHARSGQNAPDEHPACPSNFVSATSMSIPGAAVYTSHYAWPAGLGDSLNGGFATMDDPLFGFNNTFPFAMNGGSFT